MAIFEHVQDVIGQLPVLKSYSHMLICFPVQDDKREVALQELERAVRLVMKTFPYLSGRVINEGSGAGSSGTFKVTTYKEWESETHVFVRIQDRTSDCPGYDELCSAQGPSSMLPGHLLSSRVAFPETYQDT